MDVTRIVTNDNNELNATEGRLITSIVFQTNHLHALACTNLPQYHHFI